MFFFTKKLLIKKKWLLITSPEKYELVENYCKEGITKQDFKLIKYSADTLLDKESFTGIVVDKNYCKNIDYSNLLKQAQRYKLEIVSINLWIEKNMKLIANEFIDEGYLNTIFLKLKKKKLTIFFKRIGDIFLSLFLILLTSPIIFLASICIWLQDRGPIIYKQIRSGFKNKNIKIYKMRTMVANSEKNGPQWSSYNDKRITKIGNFLRRTRLDELPQLFAVIKGDMSLIGPRPERPKIDLELESKIKFYNYRYNIKPGISGWAQVNYPYGASIKDSKMKLSYDLFYLKNLSIFLDFVILLKTIKVVFTGKGSKPKNTF